MGDEVVGPQATGATAVSATQRTLASMEDNITSQEAILVSMEHRQPLDRVARIQADWRRERPDVDVSPQGVIGRLHRLADQLTERLCLVYGRYGLSEENSTSCAPCAAPVSPTNGPPASSPHTPWSPPAR